MLSSRYLALSGSSRYSAMKSEARGEEVYRAGVVYNNRPYALEDGDMRGLGQ